jgi:hypothetical protein
MKSTLLACCLMAVINSATALAQDADTIPATPHDAHHSTTAPVTTDTQKIQEQEPPKSETDSPATGESTSKGLTVHRAPDFCMKKDPPPHCSE